MAERAAALAHLPMAGSSSATVSLQEVRAGSILQAAAWPGSLPTVEAAIRDLLGAVVPPLGGATADGNVTVAAIAPGRFLIATVTPDLAVRFEAALTSEDGAVTDLSHGRVILRLDGEAAAALLAKCVALDLHEAGFPSGRFAQTMIHHIDIGLHRLSRTSFEIWVLRSFAESLAEWLLDAGLEFGLIGSVHS
jgi:heterotetrameric sarcosine oxidase gamma subunit